MKSLRSPFVPIVLAILALAVSAVCDLAAPRIGVFEFAGTSRHGDYARVGDGEYDELRLIPNPFAAETLLAQPNRAAIQVTAPYRVTVGVAAVQLTSSGNVNGGVCVKALVPGQTLYLGVSSAVTTATGWPMTDNESLCLEVRNANVLWGIASAAAQSVAVLPFSRF